MLLYSGTRHGDINMAVCLVWSVEQRKLGVIVPNIELLEVYGTAGAFQLELLLDLLSLDVIPVSEVDVRTEAMIQGYSSCADSLCSACRQLVKGFAESLMSNMRYRVTHLSKQ